MGAATAWRPSGPLVVAATVLALSLPWIGCGGDGGGSGGTAGTPAPAVALPTVASECDLFAAVGGSDQRGDGSLANPWEHVDFLVAMLRDASGHRVGCLRAGTFTPTGVDPSGGEPSLRFDTPNVTLMSYPGERARIVGRIYVSDGADGATIANLDLAMRSNLYPGTTCTGVCGNSSFPIAASGVTIAGNDITNDGTDICLQLIDNGFGVADDAVISGNRIHDCGPLAPRSNTAHAIYVNDSTGSRITGNLLYDNGAFGFKLGPRAVGTTASGNVLDRNGVGVLVGDQPPCPTEAEASRDNLISGNVITRSQARNNIEGFWATPDDGPGCFAIGAATRGNVVSGNCVYADNPHSDGPDDGYNHNGGIGLRDPAVPESGGFADDGTNLIIAPSAQPVMPPIYADPANGGYHLLSVEGDGNDCREDDRVTDVAAVANSRWTAPVELAATAGGPGADPVTAVGADGAAAAAWIDGSTVWALSREPGAQTGPRRWGGGNPSSERPEPERVSGPGASGVRIAVGGSGPGRVSVAVWRRASGDGVTLQTAVRSGGTWSAPEDLAPAGARTPAVAVGTDGTAVVAWSRGDAVAAAVRPAGASGFQPAHVLATSEAAEPQVAVAPEGTAAVVWSARAGADRVVQTAGFDGTDWTAAETLSQRGGWASQPEIATGAGGMAVATWRWSGAAGSVAQAALRSAAGAWGEPVTLSAPDAEAEAPRVGIGADGSAVTAWISRGDDGRTVLAAERPASGGFGTPEQISAPGAVADARLAVAADGGAIAVWTSGDRATGYRRVSAATLAPDGGWSGPATLSTFAPGAGATAPWPAIGTNAGGLAVWVEAAGSDAAITSSEFWF